MDELQPTWILCRAQPQRHDWAIQNIKRVAPTYETYLPYYFDPDEKKKKIMFGSYLFVRIVNGQWRCLTGVWGLSSVLVNSDESPMVVADRDIERIRKMEVAGVVQLALSRFKKGDRIIITAGPLKFECGWFIERMRKRRVKVSLDGFMGKGVQIELDDKSISSA